MPYERRVGLFPNHRYQDLEGFVLEAHDKDIYCGVYYNLGGACLAQDCTAISPALDCTKPIYAKEFPRIKPLEILESMPQQEMQLHMQDFITVSNT